MHNKLSHQNRKSNIKEIFNFNKKISVNKYNS